MKQEIMICMICSKVIDSKDNYVCLTDYKQGMFFQEGFYHTNCYNERLSGGKEKTALKKVTFGLLARANRLMDKAEVQLQ